MLSTEDQLTPAAHGIGGLQIMGLRAPPMLGSCGAVGVVEWFYGTADPDFLWRSGLIVEKPFGTKSDVPAMVAWQPL